MIQDAHPVRSGIPDGYKALYKITSVVAASNWAIDQDRLPSGFGGVRDPNTGLPTANAFVSTGRGRISYPQGMRVRGIQICADRKLTSGTIAIIQPTLVNFVDGQTDFLYVITSAPTVLANPNVGEDIFVEVMLETV